MAYAPFIKVCGIQTPEEAIGAVKAGANTIGLLLGLTHLASDGITPETGRASVSALPKDIRTVMATHLLDAKQISIIADFVGVSAVQIHDDLPVKGIQELRRLLPRHELIKAVHVTGEDAIPKARSYASYVDYLLLDSRTKDRLGGTGLTHDWDISRRIVLEAGKPVILAGGLKPENVTAAIEKVGPAGVDANSGLEHPDGSKDFEKIAAFAQAGLACRYPPG